MEANQISVLIAHSGTMAGELLADAVKRQSDLRVAAQATRVEETLEILQSTTLDVALVGATLGNDSQGGFRVLQHMRHLRHGVRSILLFENPEPHLVVHAFRAGAKGVFCLAGAGFQMLCKCVRQVHRGHIWVSNREVAYVMEAFAKNTPSRVVSTGGFHLLSKREKEVVGLVAEGLQNREIARELKLSSHTVKNYLFRVFDKLGVSTRVELALYAANNVHYPASTGSQRQERPTLLGVSGQEPSQQLNTRRQARTA